MGDNIILADHPEDGNSVPHGFIQETDLPDDFLKGVVRVNTSWMAPLNDIEARIEALYPNKPFDPINCDNRAGRRARAKAAKKK